MLLTSCFSDNMIISMKKRHTTSSIVPGAGASHRRERLTVSLSPSSAEFLRKFSAEAKLHVSTVVENMIENSKRAQELAQLNAGISAFYDSLPDAVLQEQAAWGETGTAGLAEVFESEIEPAAPEIAQTGD
jgi:hypothetical protein